MPTQLPSGLVIVNVTPHPLSFWCGVENGAVTAPSDAVVHGKAVVTKAIEFGTHILDTIRYVPTPEGTEILAAIKLKNPDCLIVGSLIAAQAYREEVVAPIPLRSARDGRAKIDRYNRSDRFTFFEKEDSNG